MSGIRLQRFAEMHTPKGWFVLALLTGVLVLLVPVLNLFPAHDSFLHIPDYVVTLLGKIFCYAILGIALDLVW